MVERLKAISLINVEIGSTEDVMEQLLKIDGLSNAYMVYGVYDIVAIFEAESMEEIKKIVTWRVRRLTNIKSTLTCLVVEND